MAEPLASKDDVVALLGRALTSSELARVDGILSKASNLFRHEARQKWEAGRETVRLKSNGGRILLTQRKATTVHGVVDDHGTDIAFKRHNQWLTTGLTSDRFAIVDYSYDGEIPAVINEAVADIARSVLLVAESAATGINASTETAGPWSRTTQYAAWAQGGQTRLSPADTELARSFRIIAPRMHVMSTGPANYDGLPSWP